METVLRTSALIFYMQKAKPIAKAAPKVAPKKAATAKAAPKKLSQTTLKPRSKSIVPKKRAKPDSEDENSDADRMSLHDDSLLSVTPPSAKKQQKAPAQKKTATKPLREVENEALAYDGADDPEPKKGSKSTETYQKVSVVLSFTLIDDYSWLM